MGRLVGTGGLLVVLAVVGLFLGLGAYFVEDVGRADDEGTSSVSFMPTKVDPACLWPVLSAALSPDAPDAPSRIPLQGCAPAEAEEETEGDWVRVSLQQGEPGDADFERRFSGIRAAQLTDDARLTLEAYDNWGGSGVFSSLVTGRVVSDGRELSEINVHGFGDRCNGGLAGTRVGTGERLFVSANMTPWDIMAIPLSDLDFDAQWAAGQERFGPAFGLAPSCASCCSAVTSEYELGADGSLVSVGLRHNLTEASPLDDPLTLCLEQSVEQAAGNDGLVDKNEEADLSRLIDACAADVEN